MPRYDYRCADGHVTEAIHPMASVPVQAPCGTCEQPAQRIYQPPAAIHFKGSGFYTTDVTSRLHRKRRKGAGDQLPAVHDPMAATIANAI